MLVNRLLQILVILFALVFVVTGVRWWVAPAGVAPMFGLTLGEQTSALLDGFEVQRVAVFDAIEDERQMILEAIEQERISILDDLDNKLRSTTEELDSVGKGLIDHFFKRLIQVLIGMGVFVLVVVAIILFAARRRRNDED